MLSSLVTHVLPGRPSVVRAVSTARAQRKTHRDRMNRIFDEFCKDSRLRRHRTNISFTCTTTNTLSVSSVRRDVLSRAHPYTCQRRSPAFPGIFNARQEKRTSSTLLWLVCVHSRIAISLVMANKQNVKTSPMNSDDSRIFARKSRNVSGCD